MMFRPFETRCATRVGALATFVFCALSAVSGAPAVAQNGPADPALAPARQTTEVQIDVPDLVIRLRPVPVEIAVDVPDLTIVARPYAQDIVIEVPDLTIVTARKKQDDPDLTERMVTQNEITPSPQDPPPQDDADPVPLAGSEWCVGTFDAHIGIGLGTAIGFAMPFGQNMVTNARITAVDCRQSLSFNADGQTLLLTQGSEPREYTGSIDMGDGPLRQLILRCEEDLNLRGSFVTSDKDLRIDRPVWLIRKPTSAANLEGCEDAP